VFYKEKITLFKIIGTVIAMTGIWLISVNAHSHSVINIGILLLILAALSLSVFFILQKSAIGRYTGLELTCYAVWIATIVFITVNTPQATINIMILHHGKSLFLAAFLGIFCTSIAFWLWAYALSHIEVSKASIATYTVPFISALLAYYLLGEPFSVNLVLGGSCIIAGVLIATVFRGRIRTKVEMDAAVKPRHVGSER
jgi:drug/metabolite transporter (DMT)-like permease